jgi:hypothetical protein
VSLAAHALLVAMLWRLPWAQVSGPSLRDAIEVDVRLATDPAFQTPGTVHDPGASAPAAPRSPAAREVARWIDRTTRPPRAVGRDRKPTSTSAAAGEHRANPFFLRMRSPVEASPLTRAPPGTEPADAARPSGLPFLPPPDVIHHPLTPQVQGGRTTSSGLGVKVGSDGAISFRDPKFVQDVKPGLGVLPGMVGLGGRFDINDLTERAAGNDPYAYEKRKIAEATFEERLCLAQQAALARKQEGLFHLKDRLEKLLHLPGLTAARRREIVFEWWDECVDDTADNQPNLGAAARATILVFIRRVFPPESPDAYTPAELAALNGRRVSRGAFDPYDTGRTPDAGER